jgi:hypothetical protein
MDSLSTPEGADPTPSSPRSVVGLMIAIAFVVLGIVFVLALLDMRGGAGSTLFGGPTQNPQGDAKAAPPL